jgi:threonine dehydrogenase-like Zn-dependent dehydrogenase
MPDAQCLTYTAPGQTELRSVPRALEGATGDLVELRALWSGISRGTERLVFTGAVPSGEYQRMRAPFQHGSFPFPVGYGYAWVGEDGEGRRFFGLFPHQDLIAAPEDALCPLPEGFDERRAVLAANMETALNIAWDAGAGPADRIAVVGGGVLGLLVAGILADIPGVEVTVVDVAEGRAPVAAALGARFASPDDAPEDVDIAIHTSASEAGLATCLAICGVEATIVEASWFGTLEPKLPLGGAFHSKRLTLRSSQVGMVSPGRRPRWSYKRRLSAALALLQDDKYDALITRDVRFSDLPARIPDILAPQSDGLATAVSYL